VSNISYISRTRTSSTIFINSKEMRGDVSTDTTNYHWHWKTTESCVGTKENDRELCRDDTIILVWRLQCTYFIPKSTKKKVSTNRARDTLQTRDPQCSTVWLSVLKWTPSQSIWHSYPPNGNALSSSVDLSPVYLYQHPVDGQWTCQYLVI
jgi:hypothetical protein